MSSLIKFRLLAVRPPKSTRNASRLFLVIAVSGLSFLWIARANSQTQSLPISNLQTINAEPGESVRSELARLQKQTGLTLAFYENSVQVVSFKKGRMLYRKDLLVSNESGSGGEVSPDGTQIAIGLKDPSPSRMAFDYYLGVVRYDGSAVREFPEITPIEMCWSHDQSKIAITAYNHSPNVSLVIFDLGSKMIRVVVPVVVDSRLTSQCWSPDDKQIVYESEGSVRIAEIGKERSVVLAKGQNPTWSPVGDWVAFCDHGTYYSLHPGEETPKKLFHRKRAVSGLYWSPDARFVAYVVEDWFALDVESYSLRVRRLADNSDDRVAEAAGAGAGGQWVTNKELLTLADAKP